jgi:chemotaxis protein CheX
MDTTYDTQIEQIVQSIFSSMLGMEVVRSPEGAAACDECVLGTIQITGARSMSVILGVSDGAARAATSAMLMLPIQDISDTDSRDVVAELANMIGGNLKSLLPGPLYLSLPTVVAGRDLGLQVPGAELVEDVSLSCEAGGMRVRLFAQLKDD